MSDLTIAQALGDDYSMFYHSSWPAKDLKPMCTLEKSVSEVNRMLSHNGKDLSSWSARNQDEIARLMRTNWIWQRLNIEPIRKPILAHLDDDMLVVDCGDTRLMALSLLPVESTVSVVCTTRKEFDSKFQDWTRINNNQELIDISGFGADACVLISQSTDKNYALSWLEIGDQTTAHHLHDVNQRIEMMQCYLDCQSQDFEFTVDWAKNYINWQRYLSRFKC